MNQLVLVLTDFFPYEVGEEFFEQEIGYLADAVDEVLCVPMRAHKPDRQTRALPKNASAVLPDRPFSDNKWVTAGAYLPKLMATCPELVDWSNWRKPEWIMMDIRFGTHALEVYDRVSKALKGKDFSQYSSVVLYSYWFYTGVAVAQQLKENEFKGVPVTIMSRAHAYDVDEDDSPRGYLPARPYLMQVVNRVCAISNYSEEILKRRVPQLANKVAVRRLGVPQARRVRRTRKAPFWIVSCSHLADYKRIELLIESLAVLESWGYRFRWTHVGERDQAKIAAKQALVKELGIRNEVEFTGYIPNEQARALYANPDMSLFVNSSTGEGVPVSIMEAQAYGLPVVATSSGGTAEIVHDQSNGVVVPVDCTAEDFAQAIRQVIDSDDEQYQSMCIAAHDTWDAMSNAKRQYRWMANDIANRLKQTAK
ncbi:glycosyltransferase [Gleimia hominis]|uniref:Glycosyltransferase n=1 Tax=Gleimia hominis TaxID=595468 RepID=A0ABU3IBB3_9ACTO|nr:glycosyltransferase [Gleimia hominis]MDT3767211.1 glycosyltransferase [Gleimia hominis]